MAVENELDPSALYNIKILSFNNIKGGENTDLPGVLRILIELEKRGVELVADIRALGVAGLSLQRRALSSHSEFRFRVTLEAKRDYAQYGDEKYTSFLASLSSDMRDEIQLIASETVILNANLKVYWTIYNEILQARRLFNHSIDEHKPSTILELCIDSTESVG